LQALAIDYMTINSNILGNFLFILICAKAKKQLNN
jgi:hypothetical protein